MVMVLWLELWIIVSEAWFLFVYITHNNRREKPFTMICLNHQIQQARALQNPCFVAFSMAVVLWLHLWSIVNGLVTPSYIAGSARRNQIPLTMIHTYNHKTTTVEEAA